MAPNEPEQLLGDVERAAPLAAAARGAGGAWGQELGPNRPCTRWALHVEDVRGRRLAARRHTRTFSALLVCSCCRACGSDPLRTALQGRQSWLIAIHARHCAAAITPDSQKMRPEPGLALPAGAGADFPAGPPVGALLTQPHTTARPGAAGGCSQGEPTELRLAFIPAGPPGTPQHPDWPQQQESEPPAFCI